MRTYIPVEFSISEGWLIADGQKLCKVMDGRLVFSYKSKKKAEVRGCDQFGISISALKKRLVDDKVNPL